MLLFLLLASLISAYPHTASAAELTYLKIVNPLTGNEWFSFTSQNKSVGDTFIANVTVANVVNMGAWQVALQWNSSLLEFVRLVLPSDNVFAGQRTVTAGPDTSIAGMVIYGAAVGPGQPGFNGSGVLAQVEMKILQGIGESDLSFEGIEADTFLTTMSVTDIPFTPVIGHFDFNILGDVSNDGVVNMKDVMLVVKAFNSFPNTPSWNPRLDLDNNGRVDMRDISMVLRDFNKHV